MESTNNVSLDECGETDEACDAVWERNGVDCDEYCEDDDEARDAV